jgi:hypothetical protein
MSFNIFIKDGPVDIKTKVNDKRKESKTDLYRIHGNGLPSKRRRTNSKN